MAGRQSKTLKQATIFAVIAFSVVVVFLVVSMNLKATMEQQQIIEDSVESQLISISTAAREIIDPAAFSGYNSVEDVERDAENYLETRRQLRILCDNVDADYIYALKELTPGRYVFVFDTDIEDEEIFIDYELSDVHVQAFSGIANADTMNVEDEYGSFNTGAVPIYHDGQIVGIIATDIRDLYLEQSQKTATTNAVTLIVMLVVVMAAMLSLVAVLISRVRKMQRHLEFIAHHDTVTGLYNRQYLLDHLHALTSEPPVQAFAVFFVDLDNFKNVNDNEGHDAGDASLRLIAEYLDSKTSASAPGNGLTARIGGDEFVQILPGMSDPAFAQAYARELLAEFFTAPLNEHIRRHNISLSVGWAHYPIDSTDYNVLIKMADTAMYQSKKQGKNRAMRYDFSMPLDIVGERQNDT